MPKGFLSRATVAPMILINFQRLGGDTPCQTRGIVESGHSDWNLVNGNVCIGMAELKNDIIVIGGGLAGVEAAIAAAPYADSVAIISEGPVGGWGKLMPPRP